MIEEQSDGKITMHSNPLARQQIKDIELPSIRKTTPLPTKHHTPTQIDRSPACHQILIILIYIITILLSISIFSAIEYLYGNRIPTVFNNPLPQTIFIILIIASCTDFSIRLSGSSSSTNPFAIRKYKYSMLTLISIPLLTIIVTTIHPNGTYRFPPLDMIQNIHRGNCSIPLDVDPDFFEVCPTFDKTSMIQVYKDGFRTNDYGETVDALELPKKMIYFIKQVQDLKPVLSVLPFDQFKETSKIATNKDECINLFLASLCEMGFSRCSYSTCDYDSTCALQHTVHKMIECGSKDCKKDDMCNVEIEFSTEKIREWVKAFMFLMRKGFKELPEAEKKMLDRIANVAKRYANTTEYQENFQNEHKCLKWYNNYLNNINQNIVIVNNSKSSCNPNKNTTSVPGTKETNDATVILFTIFFVNLVAVVAFSHKDVDIENKNGDVLTIGIRLTYSRIAVFLICLTMSILIFIGACELQYSAYSVTEEISQKIWTIFYFIVSYLCFHGGLILLTPPPTTDKHEENDETDKEDGKKDEKIDEEGGNKDQSKQLNQRRQSMIFPTLTTKIETKCDRDCNKCQNIASSFKQHFMDADGKWFPYKLLILEVTEFVVQFNALLSSAPTSDAALVLISAIVISINLIILPITAIVASKVFQSPTLAVATTLTIELLFDKLFTAVAVLLRPNTITEANLSFFNQFFRHLGCLLPALLTSLDVHDILTLASHVEENTLPTKMHKTKLIFTATSGLSICCGCFLLIFSITSFQQRDAICFQVLGPVTSCMKPKLYYKNGFFSPTNCSFGAIKTINCGKNIMAFNDRLPDAVSTYSNMASLSEINISNNKYLKNIPSGFGSLPNSVNIILKDNPQMSILPYVLCTNNNVKSIQLDGSLAAKSIVWDNQQILNYQIANNMMSNEQIYLTKACRQELFPSLLNLSLANNSLKCKNPPQSCAFNGMQSFKNLQHLDLDHNNISQINAAMTGSLQTVIENSQNANTNNEDVSISMLGNSLSAVRIVGQPKQISKGWLNILKRVNIETLTKFNLATSQLTYEDVQQSVLNNNQLQIEEIKLTGLPWTKLHHFLHQFKKTLKNLKINYMGLQNLNEQLHELFRLEHCEIEGNVDLKIDELKYALKDLGNVKHFSFYESNLKKIVNFLPGDNYDDLDFRKNRIKTISVDAFENKSILNLNLTDNSLESIDLELFHRMNMNYKTERINWDFQNNRLGDQEKGKLWDYFLANGFTPIKNKETIELRRGVQDVVGTSVVKISTFVNGSTRV